MPSMDDDMFIMRVESRESTKEREGELSWWVLHVCRGARGVWGMGCHVWGWRICCGLHLVVACQHHFDPAPGNWPKLAAAAAADDELPLVIAPYP